MATACAASTPPPSSPSALLDRAAPALHRQSLDGRVVDTNASRGRLTVVKFFARSCGPCRATLPAAQRLADASGVSVLGVDEDDDEADARALVAELGLRFPVVHDRGRVLAGRFRVTVLPTSFVIDAQGVVRWVGGPEQPPTALERIVR